MAVKMAHFSNDLGFTCLPASRRIPIVKAQASLLLIDHEQEALAKLAEILSTAGYRCLSSTDAESAIQCVRLTTPHLIIADINLAGHSGATLCEHLKQQGGMADVPVMFFSGTQTPDIIRRADAAGGTYYLRKPCDPDVLLELIDQALAPRFKIAALASN